MRTPRKIIFLSILLLCGLFVTLDAFTAYGQSSSGELFCPPGSTAYYKITDLAVQNKTKDQVKNITGATLTLGADILFRAIEKASLSTVTAKKLEKCLVEKGFSTPNCIARTADDKCVNTKGEAGGPTCTAFYDSTGVFGLGSGAFAGCLVPPSKVSQNTAVTNTIREFKPSVEIPCQPIAGGKCGEVTTPAGYIARLYQFALMIAGLLAFGSIVYGGLRYVLSAGGVIEQQDAKDQIQQAILGIILLLGAYLILNTINPELVKLSNPNLEPINIETLKGYSGEGGSSSGSGGTESGGTAQTGAGQTTIPNCKLELNTGINFNLSGTQNEVNVQTGTTSSSNLSYDANPKICFECNSGFVRGKGLSVAGCVSCADARKDSDYKLDDLKDCP